LEKPKNNDKQIISKQPSFLEEIEQLVDVPESERRYTIEKQTDDMLDELCRNTCILCPDPCCLSADVRYDLRDLLFLKLTDQVQPAGQPREMPGKSCRYLGTKGCTLPRFSRPWICTWYLCPVQKSRLLRDNGDSLVKLTTEIKKIQQTRKEMETAFIKISL